MSFKEVTDDGDDAGSPGASDAAKSKVDLTGVPELLKDFVLGFAQDPLVAERQAARARRVALNKDGSVGVTFLRPIEKGDEKHDGVRLRAIRVRDYYDGTTAAIADSNDLADAVQFATKLAPKSMAEVIDSIESLDDMFAVYLGVVMLRKNFSRPRT